MVLELLGMVLSPYYYVLSRRRARQSRAAP
jgi:hypothetical protein